MPRTLRVFLLDFVVVFFFLAAGAPRRADAACDRTEPASLLNVRMKEFGVLLGAKIDACATEARSPDAKQFWSEHGLEPTEARMHDYVRVRTIFEMARDGGPWRLRWAITNQEPSAKKIWTAWRAAPPTERSAPSAVAECDELSALFAGISRRVGLSKVGLFWPSKNHTIAAWEPASHVRVLIPTTQIYSRCDDTFDRTSFSPAVQRHVFEFPIADVPDATPVPPALAAFLLDQVAYYAAASLDVLAAIRTHRALAMASSVDPSCRKGVIDAATRLGGTSSALGSGDRAALRRYGTELGLAHVDVDTVLGQLARQ